MRAVGRTWLSLAAIIGLDACPLIADAASDIETLSQGWSPAEQEAFWFGDQGSRLLSYDLFVNLEQANSADLFRAPANIARLGYIPWVASQRNPDGLPIGFVKDIDPTTGAAAMGFTCAACHTSTIKVNERILLIDGGQTLADATRFLDTLVAAMQANQEGEKLDRLVTRMHGAAAEAGPRKDLLARLRAETAALEARRDRNRSTTEYGHGRLDAFGQIFNEVAANTPGTSARSPSAPVSYPFLWSAPQSDFVQWNGVSPNAPPFGSLDRNVTEVLGVFGQFSVPADNPAGRSSSVRVPLLAELENLVEQLWRPSWREAGLPLDETKFSDGERVYQEHCGGCHLVLDDPTAPRRSIDAKMIELADIGTDPRMAIDATAIEQATGKPYLELVKAATGGILRHGGKDTFEAVVIDQCNLTAVELDQVRNAPSASSPELDEEQLKAIVADVQHCRDRPSTSERLEIYRRALDPQMMAYVGADFGKLVVIPPTSPVQDCGEATPGDPRDDLLCYKARPLDGIWATAPFLHNGSVPTLADLLTPPSDRPKMFRVGSNKLDTERIGFASSMSGQEGSVLDTTKPGNWNSGHVYGTDLPANDKAALLEYLKTL